MKPWVIVQARATSTRLPRKIFKVICGKSLLEHQIDRLRRATQIENILVATTRQSTDDETVALCRRLDLSAYRGDEADVLSRYFEAALFVQASAVVRVTSDCPLIDATVLDSVVRQFEARKADYASNTLKRTFPRGLDVEVFSWEALKWAYHNASSVSDREHVTPAIRGNEHFSKESVEVDHDRSAERWTVDTDDDFELIRRVYEALYAKNPAFSTQDVYNLLEIHEDWRLINAHIEQKKI